MESDPDGEYLDVCGVKTSAADVADAAGRIAAALAGFGVERGDRVASLIENSNEAMLAWWGIVAGGGVAVPINTAYKGEYLRHQLADSGARVLLVESDLADRAERIVDEIPSLEHVVVLGDAEPRDPDAGAPVGRAARVGPEALRRRPPERPRHLHLHRRHHRPVEGLHAQPRLPRHPVAPDRHLLAAHRRRRGVDAAADVPLQRHRHGGARVAVYGGRAAIYRRFSVSNFWSEMNRVGATVTSTLGTMAYLLANDIDRPEQPRSGAPEANTTLRLIGAAPLPVEIDQALRERFGVDTFSGAYGVTEASLVSWQPPGVENRPNAAGVINDEYFDVRIFDDDDGELPRGTDGEIVLRPKRPHTMFEGYWGRPDATVETSRNWWYHTGDIGRIDDDGYLYFVDRKADYLRRRGENISSFEVERIVVQHPALADVAVHAVPSQLTEDDLKITATVREDATVTEEELFRWCIDELPYFALPRYIELRAELPRSPVGRVLKRELRDEAPTDAWWDAEASGITYEKR